MKRTRRPITLLDYADAAYRAGLLTLSVVALALGVVIEWRRRKACKRCGAKPDPALLREDGCVLCRERGR